MTFPSENTEYSPHSRAFDQGEFHPNPRMTLDFFARIARPIETVTWQTFDDDRGRKDPSLVTTKFGIGHSKSLAALNRKGAGVFFAVNVFDGTRHKLPDLKSIACLHADFDDGVPANCPLEPTARVQSSICPETGLVKEQWIWRLEQHHSLTIDEHQSLMKWVTGPVAHGGLGGDHRAKDVCRVMRPPGFHHCKGHPQLVELAGQQGPFYRAAQLLDAAAMFRPPKSSPPVHRTARKSLHSQRGGLARIESALTAIPADDYGDWIAVGAALHNETKGSEDGLALWDTWSTASGKYVSGECPRRWPSFGRRDGSCATAGKIIWLARQNGWRSEALNAGRAA